MCVRSVRVDMWMGGLCVYFVWASQGCGPRVRHRQTARVVLIEGEERFVERAESHVQVVLDQPVRLLQLRVSDWGAVAGTDGIHFAIETVCATGAASSRTFAVSLAQRAETIRRANSKAAARAVAR